MEPKGSRASAKGSATAWSVKNKINLACKITSDQAIEVISTDYLVEISTSSRHCQEIMCPFIEKSSFLETFCLKNMKSSAHQRNLLGGPDPMS